MKYVKSFESTIKDRVERLREIEYNIKCLIMDYIDLNYDVQVRGSSILTISIRSNKLLGGRFENIIDHLLSLIDYMETVDFKYHGLSVTLGPSYKEIDCKIVDGKLKKYPLKDGRFIAEYLISGVKIEFSDRSSFKFKRDSSGKILN